MDQAADIHGKHLRIWQCITADIHGKNTRLTCIHSQAWGVTVGVWQVNIHLGAYLAKKLTYITKRLTYITTAAHILETKLLQRRHTFLETNIKAGKHWRPVDIHVEDSGDRAYIFVETAADIYGNNHTFGKQRKQGIYLEKPRLTYTWKTTVCIAGRQAYIADIHLEIPPLTYIETTGR